jgi:Tfp pilus assembly protein PilO
MGIRRVDRLWLLGGVFAIMVIVAAAYFLAIKPVYTKTAEYQGQVDDSAVTLVSLKHDLADRQAQYKDRAKYIAELTSTQGHLPDSYDIPDFVRAVQSSGTAASVLVSGISVGPPSKVTGADEVVGVSITLTAAGTPANLGKFLDRLQNVQERAVLINSISLAEGTVAGTQSATLILNAFCTKNETTCTLAG